MADVEMDWDRAPDEIGMFFSPEGSMTAVPFGGRSWRIVAALDGSATKPSEEFFAEALERRAGVASRNSRVSWMSSFTAHCRLAATYRLGRGLLAGDAAHVHSPVGGQGMNTGLQDALNLGWKLAAVLDGAPPALLDTYEAERRPVARGIMRMNAQMTRLAVARGGVPKFVRTHLLPRALALPTLTRRMGRGISGLGVEYSRSTVSGPGGGSRAPFRSGFYKPRWELFEGPGSSLTLVRPDSYVGAQFDGDGAEAAASFLRERLGNAAALVSEGRRIEGS